MLHHKKLVLPPHVIVEHLLIGRPPVLRFRGFALPLRPRGGEPVSLPVSLRLLNVEQGLESALLLHNYALLTAQRVEIRRLLQGLQYDGVLSLLLAPLKHLLPARLLGQPHPILLIYLLILGQQIHKERRLLRLGDSAGRLLLPAFKPFPSEPSLFVKHLLLHLGSLHITRLEYGCCLLVGNLAARLGVLCLGGRELGRSTRTLFAGRVAGKRHAHHAIVHYCRLTSLERKRVELGG
mmetsp:Transcript_14407/g.28679  ORF Transcript_14407/g.28679 Transcript_14407/m.28679 type:complete len:237 (-) Transcript_14407:19-729(-)